MTMTYFISESSSGEAAVNAKHLCVYPAAIRAGQERDGITDVLWRPKPLYGSHLGQLLLRSLLLSKRFRHRRLRYRIHRWPVEVQQRVQFLPSLRRQWLSSFSFPS